MVFNYCTFFILSSLIYLDFMCFSLGRNFQYERTDLKYEETGQNFFLAKYGTFVFQYFF